MAGREGGDQHLFGVVAGSIAAESRVGRSGNRRLALAGDFVIPAVGGVAGGVAAPADGELVAVLSCHLRSSQKAMAPKSSGAPIQLAIIVSRSGTWVAVAWPATRNMLKTEV